MRNGMIRLLEVWAHEGHLPLIFKARRALGCLDLSCSITPPCWLKGAQEACSAGLCSICSCLCPSTT